MAKYCVIENDKVINMAVAEITLDEDGNPSWVPPENWVEQADGAQIGWGYIGGVFIDPETNLTLADAKKIAIGILKGVYKGKTEEGVINGITIGNITDEIQDAVTIILNNLASDYVVVYDENYINLTQAKLVSIFNYKSACSSQAQTHAAAVLALTTKQEIKTYVQTTMQTGWPSTAL